MVDRRAMKDVMSTLIVGALWRGLRNSLSAKACVWVGGQSENFDLSKRQTGQRDQWQEFLSPEM